MIKEILPLNKIKTKVIISGSKSITNRALIISSLIKGKTKIVNPSYSDDSKYLIEALKKIGVIIKLKKNYIIVIGNGGEFLPYSNKIYIGNAGTAIRFMTSLLTLGNGKYVIDCDERMKERPIGDLVESLISLGANIKYLEKNGYPPLEITGKKIEGGVIQIKGDKSSQFISSLLMLSPFLKYGLTINILDELVSKPYINTTINIMQDFGVKVINKNYSSFIIYPDQKYNAKKYKIPGDASSATYFMAACAICGGKIKIKNVGYSCNQGDIYFAHLLKEMGAKVKIKKNFVIIKSNKKLNGIKVDLSNTPDIVQTLIITALFAENETYVFNIKNLRIKETDRLLALENELKKIGAKVETGEDWIRVIPAKTYNSCEIETYNDHRMAMSFAIAGLKIKGLKIRNPSVVTKSFPEFWNVFEKLYEK